MSLPALEQEVKSVTVHQALAFVSRLVRTDGVSELVGIQAHLEAALGERQAPSMSDLNAVTAVLEEASAGRITGEEAALSVARALGRASDGEQVLPYALRRMDNLAAYLIKVGTALQGMVAVLRPLEKLKSRWFVAGG